MKKAADMILATSFVLAHMLGDYFRNPIGNKKDELVRFRLKIFDFAMNFCLFFNMKEEMVKRWVELLSSDYTQKERRNSDF